MEMQISNIFSEVVAALSKDPAFDSYVYLAYRNDEAGTLGVAYARTTCMEDVSGRTSLNEYQGGDLNTGLVSNSLLKYFYSFINGIRQKIDIFNFMHLRPHCES